MKEDVLFSQGALKVREQTVTPLDSMSLPEGRHRQTKAQACSAPRRWCPDQRQRDVGCGRRRVRSQTAIRRTVQRPSVHLTNTYALAQRRNCGSVTSIVRVSAARGRFYRDNDGVQLCEQGRRSVTRRSIEAKGRAHISGTFPISSNGIAGLPNHLWQPFTKSPSAPVCLPRRSPVS